MPTLIVHAGMHKTGSSSIQHTLDSLPPERRPALIKLARTPNMSGSIREAFQKVSNKFVRRGMMEASRAAGQSERLRTLIAAALERTAEADAIVSAEGFSTLTPEQFGEFAALVRHPAIRVIAYVRQPFDLIPSRIQQRIKAGAAMETRAHLNLTYRFALRKFLAYPFTLKDYGRARLYNRCVVQDFCREVGIAVSPAEVVNANERLSRAATALMCARNLWRRRQELPPAQNIRLASALANVGGPRFELHPNFIRPAIEQNAADIRWVQRRLSGDWLIECEPAPHQVRSQADLLDFGEEVHAFLAANDPAYVRSSSVDAVGAAVDRIATQLQVAAAANSLRDDAAAEAAIEDDAA